MRPQDTAMAGGDKTAAEQTEPARKSPADFDRVAETFNAALDASLRDLAHARNEIDRQMTERDALIASAADYGVTGKWARAVLRKA